MEDFKSAREIGRKIVRETIEDEQWNSNWRFVETLKTIVAKHPLSTHPIIEFLDVEDISKENNLKIHMEFGYSFAQIFTDSVCHAMQVTGQLEPRLGVRGKTSARFLLAINCMDEVGYIPGSENDDYKGNPLNAHYQQFDDMLVDLGAKKDSIINHKPCQEAIEARASFENEYGNYRNILTILAIAEAIFDKFATPWADNVQKSTGINTKDGYHSIHVEEEDGHSIEDDHSMDTWMLLCQAITEDDYQSLEECVKNWLDCWHKFCDKTLELAMS